MESCLQISYVYTKTECKFVTVDICGTVCVYSLVPNAMYVHVVHSYTSYCLAACYRVKPL